MISLLLSILFIHTGCEIPTYKKENLEQSVIDVCKKEYNISDISVSKTGKTLYIYLKLDNIFLDSLDPSAESRRKLEDILLTTSRVCMSTNAEIDFYKIVASDDKNPGLQFIITRYIQDLTRFILGDISRGEFSLRLDMNFEFNPILMGSSLIKYFFEDLKKENVSSIMKKYFPNNVNLSNVSPIIYSMLSELSFRKERKFEIIELKSRRLTEQKAIIYCKTHEIYTKTGNTLLKDFLFPEDFYNEYLFIINIANYPKVIEKILSFYTINTQGKLDYIGFPKEFSQYSELNKWEEDLLGEVDLSLNEFLAKQIEHRILTEFKQNKKLISFYSVKSVTGEFNQEKEIFKFNIDIIKNNSPEAMNLLDNYYLDILKSTIEIATYVIRRYEIKNFKGIEFYYKPKDKKIYLTPDLIENYKKKKITVKEIDKA
mgnify:FL=1